MAKYRVAWTKCEYEEKEIDADSFDEARNWFDDSGNIGELYFIEDETGRQVVYNPV